MKKMILIFLFVHFLVHVYSQNKNDTIYIKRDNGKISQAIFIDTPHSKYHLAVFQLLLNDKMNLVDTLAFWEKKQGYPACMGIWISIYSYKGKPYGYYPSEPYFNLFIMVTDSAVIFNDFNDGLVSYAIKAFKKKRKKIIFILVDSSKKEHKLLFTQTHQKIIKVSSSLFNKEKILMTSKENFFNLPIIVNDCPDARCEEFKFK